MRWVGLALAWIIGLLMALVLLIWIGLQLPVVSNSLVSFAASRWLGVPVSIHGDVRVGVWPDLRLRARDVTVCEGTDQRCVIATGVGPGHAEIHSLHVDWEWQRMWQKQLELPSVVLKDVTVFVAPLATMAASNQAGAVWSETLHQVPKRLGEGWGINLDDLTVHDFRLVQIGGVIDEPVHAQWRRLRMRLESQDSVADLNLVIDDLEVAGPFLAALRKPELTADTVRLRAQVDESRMKIEDFIWIGGSADIRDLAGWIDVANETLSVRFSMDSATLARETRMQGFEVKVREARVPVEVNGSWAEPHWLVGDLPEDDDDESASSSSGRDEPMPTVVVPAPSR